MSPNIPNIPDPRMVRSPEEEAAAHLEALAAYMQVAGPKMAITLLLHGPRG